MDDLESEFRELKAVHIEKIFTIRQFDLNQQSWQDRRTMSQRTYSLNTESSPIMQQGGGGCSKYFVLNIGRTDCYRSLGLRGMR